MGHAANCASFENLGSGVYRVTNTDDNSRIEDPDARPELVGGLEMVEFVLRTLTRDEVDDRVLGELQHKRSGDIEDDSRWSYTGVGVGPPEASLTFYGVDVDHVETHRIAMGGTEGLVVAVGGLGVNESVIFAADIVHSATTALTG